MAIIAETSSLPPPGSRNRIADPPDANIKMHKVKIEQNSKKMTINSEGKMLVINCRNARREIQKLGQKQLRTNDHLDRMRSDPPLRGAEKTAEKGFHRVAVQKL